MTYDKKPECYSEGKCSVAFLSNDPHYENEHSILEARGHDFFCTCALNNDDSIDTKIEIIRKTETDLLVTFYQGKEAKRDEIRMSYIPKQFEKLVQAYQKMMMGLFEPDKKHDKRLACGVRSL